jgi:hypothetical protein
MKRTKRKKRKKRKLTVLPRGAVLTGLTTEILKTFWTCQE